ncbi:hypothetical protein [Nocardiopsis synnemataformans]|uniref:hypothetical protein n=1 Tax=Nocardiopsis synnemataformans TaxID=61305 RepID=UPI003EBD9358
MNSLTKLWVTLSTFLVPTSKEEDKGAGIVEYAAILILVAAIAVGIWALGIPDQIRQAIGSSVDQILQGPAE